MYIYVKLIHFHIRRFLPLSLYLVLPNDAIVASGAVIDQQVSASDADEFDGPFHVLTDLFTC
jgi:hypothetical protein